VGRGVEVRSLEDVNVRRTAEPCLWKRTESPLGAIILVASEVGLKEVLFDPLSNCWKNPYSRLKRSQSNSILLETGRQLQEYFRRERTEFEIPLCVEGSDFEMKVWRCLLRIPYGQTVSYSKQARSMGMERGARAVGLANSKNPISIIVPCHRVVGKNGALTGYGGGLERKRLLLELEGIRFRKGIVAQ
jgi:methylated-DNA-[protein]-cysteine S-methyltransferase